MGADGILYGDDEYDEDGDECGVAEKLGNPSEEEIQSWVDEVRYEKGE